MLMLAFCQNILKEAVSSQGTVGAPYGTTTDARRQREPEVERCQRATALSSTPPITAADSTSFYSTRCIKMSPRGSAALSRGVRLFLAGRPSLSITPRGQESRSPTPGPSADVSAQPTPLAAGLSVRKAG
ncbi:hypothetical protein KUCAC02_023615 [Chaenocephalus aceratus]|nr:hypothetical protein KUCAC02_023615 [Chaenocephalus aceratus]